MEWGSDSPPAAWSIGVINVLQVSASVGIVCKGIYQPNITFAGGFEAQNGTVILLPEHGSNYFAIRNVAMKYPSPWQSMEIKKQKAQPPR